MKPKRGKYDTNPLDGSVADRAEQSRGETRPAHTKEVSGAATRDIGNTANEAAHRSAESETPTRRIDDNFAASYPSVFVPPAQQKPPAYEAPRMPNADVYQPPTSAPPGIYQPPPFPATQRPRSPNVAGLNIPEKWATMLPYAPFYIGIIAALIELILVPRSEGRARFHAAQGLALQTIMLLITGFFSGVNLITNSSAGSNLFGLASTIFLIVSMVRVWKGKPHHIAPLDEATKWLNEKINPRK